MTKQTENSQKFQVGDQVRVPENAQGTAWEQGKIMYIQNGKAGIGYGSKNLADDLRIYGASELTSFAKLELIS